MPNLRLSFSTVVLDDVIYLIGGFIWQQNGIAQYLATVDAYNPETEEWSDIPPMPTPFIPFGAAVVNGNIYVLRGQRRKQGTFYQRILCFDTGSRAVTSDG